MRLICTKFDVKYYQRSIFVQSVQILFNKAVLDQLKFPYPMFLTTWHMFFATIMTQVLSRTTNMLPGVKEVLRPSCFDVSATVSDYNDCRTK